MQGPGNNPQQPFGGPPPFQPAYSSQTPSGGFGAPSGPPQIRFDTIGEAWKLLQPNLGVWIPAVLIYFVILGAISGIMSAVTGGGRSAMPAPGAGYPTTMPTPHYGGMIITQLVASVIGAFFVGGLFRMATKQVRGQMISIGDMFSASDVLPALVIAAILTNIAIFIGFMLCVIPGLLISAGLMMTTPLIVDKRLGAIEAMQASWAAMSGQLLSALLYAIVVGIVMGAGFLLCGVGGLVTMPLGLIAIAITYRDFFIGPETQSGFGNFGNFNNPNTPPIPPASF